MDSGFKTRAKLVSFVDYSVKNNLLTIMHIHKIYIIIILYIFSYKLFFILNNLLQEIFYISHKHKFNEFSNLLFLFIIYTNTWWCLQQRLIK